MTTSQYFYFAFLSSAFILVVVPLQASAAVSEVGFITSPREVSVEEISEEIKIEMQNNEGQAEALGQTADVRFDSDSNTGEFSTDNEEWESVSEATINSNWKTRRFYYRDSNKGRHTITVTVAVRETGKSFVAQQEVFVGVDNPHASLDEEEEENQSSSLEKESQPEEHKQSVRAQFSAHSEQTSLSDAQLGASFEVDAGRDRLAAVGSPVRFEALVEEEVGNSDMSFSWSFGDGAYVEQRDVEHVYEFPGDYMVVLNAEGGEEGQYRAVDKTQVKVIDPKLVVTDVSPQYIKIKNNSQFEVNIMEWSLVAGEKEFVFPKDTIIAPSQEVAFSKGLMGLPQSAEDEIELLNEEGGVVITRDGGSVSKEKNARVLGVSRREKAGFSRLKFQKELNRVKEKAEKIKNRLTVMESQTKAFVPPVSDKDTALDITKDKETDENTSNKKTEHDTAKVYKERSSLKAPSETSSQEERREEIKTTRENKANEEVENEDPRILYQEEENTGFFKTIMHAFPSFLAFSVVKKALLADHFDEGFDKEDFFSRLSL